MHSTSGFRRLVVIVTLSFALQQILLCFPLIARANPTGGQVPPDQAKITEQGTTLTVKQETSRAVINWQSFSIGAGETTRFVQPSADAAVLNRVVGFGPSRLNIEASRLDGSLIANGRVFLINPNGVVIGPGGRIETGGFFATTLDIPDGAFMAGGDLTFAGDSAAGIRNLGTIKAAAGDIILAARTVENAGTLQASNGVVGLAAGNEVLYRPAGAERLFVRSGLALPEAADGVTNTGTGLIEAAQAELRAAGGNVYALAVNNGGAIHATGVSLEDGRVLLTSPGGAIKTTGTITANKANGDGGEIRVQAEGDGQGAVTVGGTLSAIGTAPGARGGNITLTGETVTLTDTARLNSSGDAGGGLVRIGGDYQGSNPEIYNADATTVETGAEIYADALTAGNGGRVIVWSDDVTRFLGGIWARGGALSGEGGFAEVSGHSLDFQGPVTLTAPNGNWGTLLVDPAYIYISDQYTADTGDGTTDWWRPASISTMLNTAVGRYILDATESIYFESGAISWGNASELVMRAHSGGVFISKAPGGNTPSITGPNGGLELQGRRMETDSDVAIAANYMRMYTFFDRPGFFFPGPVTLGNYLQIVGRPGGYAGADSLFMMTNAGNRIPRVIFGDGLGTALERRVMAGDTTIVNGSGAMSIETATSGAFTLESTSHFGGNLTILSKGDLTLTNYLVFDPSGTGEECILSTEGRFINAGTPLSLYRGDGIPNLVSQLPYLSRMLVFSNDPRNDALGADWWWNGTLYGDQEMQGRVYAKTYADLAAVPAGNWFVYGLAPEVTLKPLGGSKVYGEALGTSLWDAAGVIPGDSLSGDPTFSSPVTQQSDVGDYAITIAGQGTVSGPSGYTFKIDNSVPGSFSVTKATLYVHPQDVTRLYGEQNPSPFPAEYAGLLPWDQDLSGAPLPGMVSGMRLYAAVDIGNPGAGEVSQQTGVGSYFILRDATGFSSKNYQYVADFVLPKLTINPAPLTVTADNKIRRIGDPNPTFTVTYTGLMPWDSRDDPRVVTEPSLSTTATVDSGSGNYPIIPAEGSGWAANYTLSYVNGTMTIKSPYQLVITADNLSKVYGNGNPAFTFTYAGFEDGETAAVISGVQATTPAGDRSPVGSYLINPSGGTFPKYYTALYVPGHLQVTPRTLNIYADNKSAQYGIAPSFTFTTDLLAGDSLSSAPALSTTGRNVGAYPITVTGGAADNYTVVRHDGTLTITPAPLWVRADDFEIFKDQAPPPFTASVTGLQYNDPPGVLQGLNLILDAAKGPRTIDNGNTLQDIVQSGNLWAANYWPITFTPGVLTTLPMSQVYTDTIKTETVSYSSSSGGNMGWTRPFGVPVEASETLRYVARNVIRSMGLYVADINAWLSDPANRALIVPALFEFFKAPLQPGTVLFNQREIIKNAFQDQIREMQVSIAKDAVARYNAWKEENAKTHTRFEGLLGNLDTPPEDFVNSATTAYIGGALSIGALGAFAVAFGVGGSMSAALPAVIAPYAATIAGSVSSAALGASGIAAGAVLAIAGTVVRAIQLTEYQKVEDRYNNLVNNAANFDINTLINGDATAQQQLFGFMLTAATKPTGPEWTGNFAGLK